MNGSSNSINSGVRVSAWRVKPRSALLVALLVSLAAAFAALALATTQPSLGLQLTSAPPTKAQGQAHSSPAGVFVADLTSTALAAGTAIGPTPSPGDRLVSLAGVELQAGDLIEEPDTAASFEEWAAFSARQDQLATALRGQRVSVAWSSPEGVTRTDEWPVTPARAWTSLPLVFWFQLLVGTLGCVSGAWVWALRPKVFAAACLCLTGFGLLLATTAAAIYSTRELALPAELFHTLSSVNHLGTTLFGIGFVGIFMTYPHPLIKPIWLLPVGLLCLVWWVADSNWWLPSIDMGIRLMAITLLLAASVLGALQWRATRGRAADRAALGWVLLSFMTGVGLFVVLIFASAFAGWLPPLSQGWSFGLFLSMYLGLALGVFRYRLFDLDRWTLRLLAWGASLAALLALDALLIYVLRWHAGLSLALSALAVGAVYFPLRQWAWAHLSGRTRPESWVTHMPAVFELGVADPGRRQRLWHQLLLRLFVPARTDLVSPPNAPNLTAVHLNDDGSVMTVPDLLGDCVWRLEGRSRGAHLFSGDDQALIQTLLDLAKRLSQAKDAYERGAREERARIATDLHDDLGARLLTLAHTADTGTASSTRRISDLARDAMADLRVAVRGLTAGPARIEDLLAQWRAESVERLEGGGVAMTWTVHDGLTGLEASARSDMSQLGGAVLSAACGVQLSRIVREAVTNVLKHADRPVCTIDWVLTAERIQLRVANPLEQGAIASERAATQQSYGYGLAGIRRRIEQLGGQVSIGPNGQGWFVLSVALPRS